MSRRHSPSTILLVALVGGVVLGGAAVVGLDGGGASDASDQNGLATDHEGSDGGVATFESREEYRSYVQRGPGGGWGDPTTSVGSDVVLPRGDGGDRIDPETTGDAGSSVGTDGADAGSDDAAPPRTSGTNVQVRGIDEPDVLETDERWAYYAGWRTRGEAGIGDPAVINASDPGAPEFAGSIPAGDRLLLAGDTLVALESDAIYGYDVSDPEDPDLRWQHSLNHTIETARLVNDSVYLVLRDDPSGTHPCPVRPMPAEAVSIPCSDVYRPVDGDGGDTTYTAMAVDARSGAVGDRVSLVGSGANTVVYVGHGGIYLTYEDSPASVETRTSYLLGPGSEHLDAATVDRIEEIQGYNLTPNAGRIEVEAAVRERLQRLPADERERVARAIQEGYQSYVQTHQRDLVRTGIVRIATDGTDLSVAETGEVPGSVHDQFSISERRGYLHVATTIDPPGTQWENDLYTLDSNLEVADAVTGMGTDQRIYSVRYVEDRAYVTTFRQVDPFHVIDVSDPENLELQGELELPGYSDYLHPLSTDRILGIGEENGSVSATVFDASDPENPRIGDEIHLDDAWSAVSQSHHAFLLDERHGVFFLPGSAGGHVVSYEDGLAVETTVRTDGPAARAAYVGDYLYVFGTEELVVVDERDWEAVERMELR